MTLALSELRICPIDLRFMDMSARQMDMSASIADCIPLKTKVQAVMT